MPYRSRTRRSKRPRTVEQILADEQAAAAVEKTKAAAQKRAAKKQPAAENKERE